MTLKRSQRKLPAVPGSEQESAENGSEHLCARVAQLAYSLYEQRGRKDGHDVEDWIQAEQTVLTAYNHVSRKTAETARGVRRKAGAVVRGTEQARAHDDSQRP